MPVLGMGVIEGASGGWGLHLKNEDGLLETKNVHLSSGQLDPTSYHSWPLDTSTGVGNLSSGQLDPT